MPNEALVQTIGRGDAGLQQAIIPNISSYDFTTDTERPTVTNGGSGTHVFYRWQTLVTIRDDVTKSVVATSPARYVDHNSNSAALSSSCIFSAYNFWLDAQTLTDAQKSTTFSDSAFQRFMCSVSVGCMTQIKYEAGLVSTGLSGWNATIRDRIKQICDDFLGV